MKDGLDLALPFPNPGMTASATVTVEPNHTARAVGSGSLDVFSTPAMIALMEQAACLCLQNCLPEGLTSVGTAIQVEHTAASSLGAEITATATIEVVVDRTIEFSLKARDGAGPIGQGRHTRALVQSDRFMNRTQTRYQTAPLLAAPDKGQGGSEER